MIWMLRHPVRWYRSARFQRSIEYVVRDLIDVTEYGVDEIGVAYQAGYFVYLRFEKDEHGED